MKTKVRYVWFNDDILGVPSGWRRIRVAVGHKWAHLTIPGRKSKRKIRISKWRGMVNSKRVCVVRDGFITPITEDEE